jgi:hypothetical protein
MGGAVRRSGSNSGSVAAARPRCAARLCSGDAAAYKADRSSRWRKVTLEPMTIRSASSAGAAASAGVPRAAARQSSVGSPRGSGPLRSGGVSLMRVLCHLAAKARLDPPASGRLSRRAKTRAKPPREGVRQLDQRQWIATCLHNDPSRTRSSSGPRPAESSSPRAFVCDSTPRRSAGSPANSSTAPSFRAVNGLTTDSACSRRARTPAPVPRIDRASEHRPPARRAARPRLRPTAESAPRARPRLDRACPRATSERDVEGIMLWRRQMLYAVEQRPAKLVQCRNANPSSDSTPQAGLTSRFRLSRHMTRRRCAPRVRRRAAHRLSRTRPHGDEDSGGG